MSRQSRLLNPPTPKWAILHMQQNAAKIAASCPEFGCYPAILANAVLIARAREGCSYARLSPDGKVIEVAFTRVQLFAAKSMAKHDAQPAWRRDLIHEHGNPGYAMSKPRKARVDLADLGL